MSANANNRQNFADWSNLTVASFNGYFFDGVECYKEKERKHQVFLKKYVSKVVDICGRVAK